MTTTLKIQNLKCHGCANTIKTQLSKIEGITNVTVDNSSNEVGFAFTNENVLDMAQHKLSDLGYPVEGEHNSLPKKAKSMVSCAIGRMTK